MDNLQVLAGSSLSLPEQDDPDLVRLGTEASNEYNGMEVVSAIGKSDFKEIYTLFINDIKSQPIVDQRRICLDILSKVKEVYDYSFLPYPELEHQLDMNNVYDLIKFLNFDYVNFLGDVWRYLTKNFRSLDIKSFCKRNSSKIIKEVEEQIKSRDLSEMLSMFLRTYNKDEFIEWFIEATEKQKMLIYLRILEEE